MSFGSIGSPPLNYTWTPLPSENSATFPESLIPLLPGKTALQSEFSVI